MNSLRSILATSLVAVPAYVHSAPPAAAAQDHHGHAHGDAAERHVGPAPLGFSLSGDWLDSWAHTDFSPRGTPFIHLFGLEPAFLDRDLFTDVVVTSADEGNETELAVELEYALTRRLGLIAEVPVIQLNPDDGATETGFGDAAIAPRALLIETDRFLLSGNLELSLPTGSESRGLGGGEAGLAPSISTWLDLGHWVTLSTQFGTERGLESGDSELFYGAALTYSFHGPALPNGDSHDHAGHDPASHLPLGLTSLILEYTGRTALSGGDRDRSTGEVLIGVSHTLSDTFELRGAYQLPVGGTRDIDYRYILSVIFHF